MLSRIIKTSLHSALRMTRGQIQPFGRRCLSASRSNQRTTRVLTCQLHIKSKQNYLATQIQGDRDQKRSELNLEGELANLQNNSQKIDINTVVDFIIKASKLSRLDLAKKVNITKKKKTNLATNRKLELWNWICRMVLNAYNFLDLNSHFYSHSK